MTTPVIIVENLGKRYRIGRALRRAKNLREALTRLPLTPFRYLRTRLRGPTEEEVLWALKEVSFEVHQGEVLGIIGSNGAGKSTLLKILSRITDPTEGYAVIHGRVNALLEVGVGFHPELTGRENVFMNAALHGLTAREIRSKLDEIVDFAGIERFLDTPVKRYSSGMKVRLGFAVAANLDPEILIVDEVLAVGDAAFQNKCLGKMENVTKEGRTVLFVSHNMAAVQHLCHKAIVLADGQKVVESDVQTAVRSYLSRIGTGSKGNAMAEFPNDVRKPIQIRSMRLVDTCGKTNSSFGYHESPCIEMTIAVRQCQEDYVCILTVSDSEGVELLRTDDDDCSPSRIATQNAVGTYIYRVNLPHSVFKPGKYTVSARIKRQAHAGTRQDMDEANMALLFEVSGALSLRGRVIGGGMNALLVPALIWKLV